MKISKLIKMLERLQDIHGDLDILVQARDSGGEYNEYLPMEDIDVCTDIYDYLNTYYAVVLVI